MAAILFSNPIFKKLHMRLFTLILASFSVLFLTGCLDNEFEEPNTEFIFTAGFGDADDTLLLDGDELRIFSVRFFVENIRVTAVDEDEQFQSNPIYVSLNTTGLEDGSLIGAGELFGGSYTGVGYNLAVPPLDAQVDDELLLERDDLGQVQNRNTLAITGMYNNTGFSIVTDETPELEYSFNRNINMPEKNGTLQVALIAEWETWFMDENMETIIDPTEPGNHQQIIENFKRFFTAQTATTGEL